jgi:Spy/CpxP family protein refolding chaperone
MSINLITMKKYILLSIICLIAISVSLQAQRPPHHGGKQHIEKMKEHLELTDEQVAQFEKMDKSLRAEMMGIKKSDNLSMDEKHAKMEELHAKKKGMMDQILTSEQKTKMEAHHAERKEKHEEHKGKMKERHAKRKAFMQEKVLPFMMGKRAELDKDIKKKERKQIAKLRAVAMTAKEEMKKQHEEMKTKREKGDKPPHFGKKGKGHHHRKGIEKMFMMKMMKEHEAEFKQAEALAEKYADEIDAIMADAKIQMDKWKSEMKEDHKGKEGHERGGKPHHRKGGKKGGESCDKSDKKAQTPEERKEMRKKMKRIGFLLMPTKMEEDVVEDRKDKTIGIMESKVYPNPSVNSNTIELNIVEKGKYTIILFNENGQQIKEVSNTKLDEGTHRFTTDLSSLPTGIYYYSITDGKTKSIEKFVKN